MRTRAGNVFIEYVTLALIVLLATIAFYTAHLKDAGVGARGSVESAFASMCLKIAGTACR